jgi:hypothetical protein
LTSKLRAVCSYNQSKRPAFGKCRGLEMGPKPSPSFEQSLSSLSLTTLHARHLSTSSHECCASSAWPQAIYLQMFSSACVSLYPVPSLLRPLRSPHGLSNITANDTTLLLRVISSKIAIFYSCWAFALAISRIRLTSFPPMPCTAFSALTSRYSLPRSHQAYCCPHFLLQASHRHRWIEVSPFKCV